MDKRQLIVLFLIAIFVGSPFANVVSAAETVSNQDTKTAYVDTCGSLALQKVLQDHGIQTSLEELDQLSKADETGISMLNLIATAKNKELNLVGKKISAIYLQKDDIVLLQVENESHYVVILNVNAKEVTIYNPSPSEEYGNEIKIPFEDFEEVYMGYAITNESNMHGKYVSKDQLAQLKGKGIGTLISRLARWVLNNAWKASKPQLEKAMLEISKALDFVRKNTKKLLTRIAQEIALQSAYDYLHGVYCQRFGCS